MHFDESELRAALREGEGAGRVPSAGSIMARAQAIRSARHMRIRNAAAAVVVIGAVGTGLGVLSAHLGGSESEGSSNAGGSAGSANAAAAPGASDLYGATVPSAAATRESAGSSTGASCPAHPVDVHLPDSHATGVDGPLFARPVASVTACGYRASHPGGTYTLRATTALTGDQARRLAETLEDASTTYRAGLCPGASHPVTVTLYARTSSGAAVPVVVIDASVPCPITVTNGTAARYLTADALPGALDTLTK
jgi:hypothetical protein